MVSGLEEQGVLNYMIDLFEGTKLTFDYFSRLKLDEVAQGSMQSLTILFLQLGLLKPVNDMLVLTNMEAQTILLKAYLRALNLTQLTSLKIINYFRRGEFKVHAQNYNMDFTESRLQVVELRPCAYRMLVFSMFLADNLGYVKVHPIRIDE